MDCDQHCGIGKENCDCWQMIEVAKNHTRVQEAANSHLRLFSTNLAVFGLGTILSRLIGIIGYPLLTYFVTNPAVLGVFDLTVTVALFGASLAGFGIHEGTFRVYFERTDVSWRNRTISAAVSLGMGLSLLSTILLFLLLTAFGKVIFHEAYSHALAALTCLLCLLYRWQSLLRLSLQIENRRIAVVSTSILQGLLFYGLALLPMLVIESLSTKASYLVCTRLVSVAVVVVWLYVLSRHRVRLGDPRVGPIKEILHVGLPLAGGPLLYFVLQFTDRIMISGMVGTYALGIFAVGAKFALVGELIRTAFSGGFPYFVYSTAKNDGHQKRMKMILGTLILLALFLFCLSFVISKRLFIALLPSEYVESHLVFPYLLVGPILLCAFQVVGADFILAKTPVPITLSQVAGVLMNVLMNLLLIPHLGILGASVATLAGYMCMLMCILVLAVKARFQAYSLSVVLQTFWLVALVVLSVFEGPFVSVSVVLSLFCASVLLVWHNAGIVHRMCAAVARYRVSSRRPTGAKDS